MLDAQSRAQLEEYCGRVEQATGVQMAMVTIDSLDGEPIEDVTNTLFRKWGVGKKGKDEGMMLLLAIKDHRDASKWATAWSRSFPMGSSAACCAKRGPPAPGRIRRGHVRRRREDGDPDRRGQGRLAGCSVCDRVGRVGSGPPRIPLPLIVIGIILLLLLMRRRRRWRILDRHASR